MQSHPEWQRDMNSNVAVDERAVSWKVLLPVDVSNSVLALGMTAEEIAGLSRSYHHIDVLPSAHKYEIIIIGKEIVDDASTDNCLSCLADEGTLVVVGSGNIRREIKRKGLICLGEYAALPPKQPRLFIPLSSRKVRDSGLSFHSPGSLQSKVWLSIAQTLSFAGIVNHLRRDTVSIWTSSVKPSNMPSIARWITERVGWNVSEKIVYTGSDSADRKITVLAMSPDCSKKVIARIADTDLAAMAIKKESVALRQLALSSSLYGLVPSFIAEGECGPYMIQLQTCLPKARGQFKSLSNAHINFLSELSKINRTNVPFRNTKTWLFVNEAVTSLSAGKLPDAINHIAAYLTNNCASDQVVDCHMTHGDFAPWNIIYRKDSILVYDWENSHPDGSPFHDVFHFIYSQANLVGPWPGSVALLKMMMDAATRLANMSKIICDPDLALSLWCINEYLCKPDPRLIELAIELNRIKNE